ncbi:MAG: hypothetical protein Phog2KO_47540 [Phototrophicaceae bacterium]
MTEKQKNKNGEIQQFTKVTTLKALAIIFSIEFLCATFYLFRAYPLAKQYSYLSVVVAIILTIVLVFFLLKGISIAQSSVDKWVLGLITLGMFGCIISRLFVILAWFSILITPIMLIILIVYTGFIMLRHQNVNLPQILKILGIAIIATNFALITQFSHIAHFQLHDSAKVNQEYYYLMTYTGGLIHHPFIFIDVILLG